MHKMELSGGKKIKMLIVCTCLYLILFLIWFTGYYPWPHNSFKLMNKTKDTIVIQKSFKVMNKTIVILQWTKSYYEEAFVDRNCSVRNCFVTADKRYFNNVNDFDVILFQGKDLYIENVALPENRSPYQKFVFVSFESSDYYPICHNKFKGYFNETWTYKLNSDMYFGYMIIRNNQGEIVGPREVMHWINVDEMQPVDEELKAKMSTKKTAAAWLVSNCDAPSGRQDVAKQLQQELAKYNMTLDIYGKCGTKRCPSKNMEECLRLVERDYYFYLSFENSFSEDYVTEKLLHGLQHYTVPIVYGGANYTRFMPNGIYLDARKLSATELAEQMVELIQDKEKYYNFFRWHNHYSYHNVLETAETHYYCRLCKRLNNVTVLKETTVHDNLMDWWNPKTLRHNVCGKKQV